MLPLLVPYWRRNAIPRHDEHIQEDFSLEQAHRSRYTPAQHRANRPGLAQGRKYYPNQQTRSLSMHVPNDNAIRPHWLDFFGLPFNGTPPSLNSRSNTLYRAIQQDSSRLATDPSKKGISRRLLSRLSAEELRLITDLAADASRRSYDAGAYGVLKDWGKVLTSLGVLYVVSHAAPSVGRMVGLG